MVCYNASCRAAGVPEYNLRATSTKWCNSKSLLSSRQAMAWPIWGHASSKFCAGMPHPNDKHPRFADDEPTQPAGTSHGAVSLNQRRIARVQRFPVIFLAHASGQPTLLSTDGSSDTPARCDIGCDLTINADSCFIYGEAQHDRPRQRSIACLSITRVA